MQKITPTTFTITREEVEDIAQELADSGQLTKESLSTEEIKDVLSSVKCDEFLARDIRRAIRSCICDAVEG